MDMGRCVIGRKYGTVGLAAGHRGGSIGMKELRTGGGCTSTEDGWQNRKARGGGRSTWNVFKVRLRTGRSRGEVVQGSARAWGEIGGTQRAHPRAVPHSVIETRDTGSIDKRRGRGTKLARPAGERSQHRGGASRRIRHIGETSDEPIAPSAINRSRKRRDPHSSTRQSNVPRGTRSEPGPFNILGIMTPQAIYDG